MSNTRFRRVVWAHYKKHGRHNLPWRKTRDPYRILVSEMMLQQTQVARVTLYYRDFLKKFPTVERLAAASLAEVLRVWQGLGYNRRAKMLHFAAKAIVERGAFPESILELEKLSGVGPYTARAICAFAFNQDGVFVETNIRTAVTHHFFNDKKNVSDNQIREVLARVSPKGKAREWYSALMDYGAYVKQSGHKLNTKSAHYTKQPTFKGSRREARGAILRALAKGSVGEARLAGLLGPERRVQVQEAAQTLIAEGLIQKRGRAYARPR